MRHRITLTLKSLSYLDRVWYRRIGVEPPMSTSKDDGRLARLVPYRFRRFHQAYAASHGYFWLPCPLCDKPFGGHEWGGSVPDPTRGPFASVGVCSACTRRRAAEGRPLDV